MTVAKPHVSKDGKFSITVLIKGRLLLRRIRDNHMATVDWNGLRIVSKNSGFSTEELCALDRLVRAVL